MTDQQNEQNIDAMIQSIITYTRGFNEFGHKISIAEQNAAIEQYQRLIRQREDIQAQRQRVANETSLAATEQTKALGLLEVEHRRLDIEAERVAVEKAQVIVRALEVAAASGVSADRLLAAIEDLGAKLLPEPRPALALEDRTREAVRALPGPTKG